VRQRDPHGEFRTGEIRPRPPTTQGSALGWYVVPFQGCPSHIRTHSLRSRWYPPGALMGRNIPAQGETLGQVRHRSTRRVSHWGDPAPAGGASGHPTLRGHPQTTPDHPQPPKAPKAPPWAGMSCPFRAVLRTFGRIPYVLGGTPPGALKGRNIPAQGETLGHRAPGLVTWVLSHFIALKYRYS
jgi:hypothetical protein